MIRRLWEGSLEEEVLQEFEAHEAALACMREREKDELEDQ